VGAWMDGWMDGYTERVGGWGKRELERIPALLCQFAT